MTKPWIRFVGSPSGPDVAVFCAQCDRPFDGSEDGYFEGYGEDHLLIVPLHHSCFPAYEASHGEPIHGEYTKLAFLRELALGLGFSVKYDLAGILTVKERRS